VCVCMTLFSCVLGKLFRKEPMSMVGPLFCISIATEGSKNGLLPKFDSKILITPRLVSNARKYDSLVEPAFWANLPLKANFLFEARKRALKVKPSCKK